MGDVEDNIDVRAAHRAVIAELLQRYFAALKDQGDVEELLERLKKEIEETLERVQTEKDGPLTQSLQP